MRDPIAELLNRPTNPAEGNAFMLLAGLFVFSLPLIVYLILHAGGVPVEELFRDQGMREVFFKLYPAAVVFCQVVSIFPLTGLALRGSKIALVGATLMSAVDVGVFIYLFL
jgi:hypothetical protein